MNDAYAAGLMDGEGSVTLPRYNKSEFRYPLVSVSSTTKELVDFLKQQFGGCISSKKEDRDSRHKKAYQWAVARNEALRFLAKVLPHMKEPEKIRRGQLILDEYLAVTPRNGRYTHEMRKAKLDFQERFFSTGTHVNLIRGLGFDTRQLHQ